MDLPEFLLARIGEIEANAQAAAPGPWTYGGIESVAGGTIYDPTVAIAAVHWDTEDVDPRIRRTVSEQQADATGEHIARHDPARVLAWCAALRAVVELAVEADAVARGLLMVDYATPRGRRDRMEQVGLDARAQALMDVLRLHVAAFADHPDFRPEWRA